MLYYQIQRYKFESNSQLKCAIEQHRLSCITKYKDTNLKAIHNWNTKATFICEVVLPNTKIQIWKQMTKSHAMRILINVFFTSHWLAIQIDNWRLRTDFSCVSRLFDTDRCRFVRGFFYEPLARNTNWQLGCGGNATDGTFYEPMARNADWQLTAYSL